MQSFFLAGRRHADRQRVEDNHDCQCLWNMTVTAAELYDNSLGIYVLTCGGLRVCVRACERACVGACVLARTRVFLRVHAPVTE